MKIMDKQDQLYGFYTRNILLQNNLVLELDAKKPGIFSRIWNWKPAKDYLILQLLREWSIHGMKYVVQRERHIIERIFWIITVLCATGMAAYFSYEVVKKYNSSPVIVSFQPSQTSVSDVPFPAVTICNVNHFKKSVMEEALKKVKEAAANNADPSSVINDIILLKEMNHVCQATKSFSTRFNFSLGETTFNFEADENLAKYLASVGGKVFEDDVKNNQHGRRIEDAIQSCEEMIHLCIWEGEEFECGKSFGLILTDFGVCCTFNMIPTLLLIKPDEELPSGSSGSTLQEEGEDFESWKKFNLDGALMAEYGKNGKFSRPRRQSKAGQNSGLSVLLHPATEEYFCATHDAYGYRIFAHSPIEFPHVLDFGLAVSPNIEMFVNVQAEVTIAEKSIRDITAEERHCYFLNEKPLVNYLHYTSINCIDECIMDKTAYACGCVTFDMYQSAKNKHPYCVDLACAEDIRTEIGIKGTKFFCKKCFPSCNRILYDTQTSSLPIRRDVNIWKSDEKRRDWSNQNVSIVHVYFGSDSVHTRVRKRLFGLVSSLQMWEEFLDFSWDFPSSV